MLRIAAVCLLGILLRNSPGAMGQTPVIQAVQSKDRRLEDAIGEIAALKRQVREQESRIAELEKTIRSLLAAAALPEKPAVEDRGKSAIRPYAARWLNPLAWAQIKIDMTRAQVEEILGKPTSVESVIDYQTLLYKRDGYGSAALSGSVKLTDDRVSEVNPPAF